MTKITEISRESSTSFSEDTEETRVKKFAKHMLKSSLFIGTFLEKRYVEPLNSYRDVIKVADDETDLINNLKAVKKRCVEYFSKNVWIGITDPKTIGAPAGYSLWVTLDEEVFGSYWYKIKNVDFYFNEIRIKLEVVRPVKEKTPISNITPKKVFQEVSQGDISDVAFKINDYFKEKLKELFTTTLTWPNVKESVVFIFLLVSTLLTFLVHAVKYLLDYILKLMHETSGLIKASTPIVISLMKLIMNTINGLYTLIAIMWRGQSPPKNGNVMYQVPMTPYQVPYYNNMRALPYQSGDFPRNRRYASSVRITPLD